MGSIINGGTLKLAGDAAVQWYRTQDEAHQTIFTHSCIGGAIALIPIPVVGELAVIANQIAMYRKLNQLTGVVFSKNVMKNIGKFVVSQVAGILGGVAVLFGLGAALKFIPGVNFAAGLLTASTAGVANYVCGKVYYEMLGGFINKGGGENLSDEEIIRRMKSEMPSEDRIKAMKSDAQRTMKGANYASYKGQAQDCVNEAKQNSDLYR